MKNKKEKKLNQSVCMRVISVKLRHMYAQHVYVLLHVLYNNK